jgi:N6-L-threonylcarbamoyladenine synthase
LEQKEVFILAIESSCDDTSAAVLKNRTVLSNIIAGQEVHSLYGGVVPELASRAHQQNIVPVVDAALKKANITIDQLDAIAFTRGPGLLGSLVVGTAFAKSIALAKNIPLIEVNHMQGHVLAHMIEDGSTIPVFPFLCLTVSGGHTQIVHVKSVMDLVVIGSTTDDAAGEAFDKTAKLLGLPYPGGPLIDKYAVIGDPLKYLFTKPKMDGYNFSFSGLKTNIIQFLARLEKAGEEKPKIEDICASVQHTILDILFDKLIKASNDLGIKEIAIAGGVAANSGLRKRLAEEGESRSWNIYIPDFSYCTDNAAMIGITGYFHFLDNNFTNQNTAASARLYLKSEV